MQIKGARQLLEEALGDRNRLLGTGQVLDEDRELVTTQASDRVEGPDNPPQPPRHPLEKEVPARVPQGVVDHLEVVEVDEEDGGAQPARLDTALQGVDDPIREEDAVGEAGQGVVESLVIDPLVEAELLHRHPHLGSERLQQAAILLGEGPQVARAAPHHQAAEDPPLHREGGHHSTAQPATGEHGVTLRGTRALAEHEAETGGNDHREDIREQVLTDRLRRLGGPAATHPHQQRALVESVGEHHHLREAGPEDLAEPAEQGPHRER